MRQRAAIKQIAQTTLRTVVGRHTLDETLSPRPGSRVAKER
jgi:regulator of protease activity HflC (stomatin/prohibitin superfamily)